MVNNSKYDSKLNIDWEYAKYGESEIKKIASQEKGQTFVAQHEGKLIGYISGSIKTEEYNLPHACLVAEIINVSVLPQYQSYGVGAKLVDKFTNWSKEQGAQISRVNSYIKNKRAINFYEELGYNHIDITLEKKL